VGCGRTADEKKRVKDVVPSYDFFNGYCATGRAARSFSGDVTLARRAAVWRQQQARRGGAKLGRLMNFMEKQRGSSILAGARNGGGVSIQCSVEPSSLFESSTTNHAFIFAVEDSKREAKVWARASR
jgi:hypothetical protein